MTTKKFTFHAVVIGIDAYRDNRIPPLSCAASDARAVSELFRSRICADEVDVKLLVDHDATKDRVTEAIAETLADKAETNDSVFLYFAGHGSPERRSPGDQDKSYLILHDTNYDRIYSTGINVENTVMDWLHDRLCSDLVVFCLDACFSGTTGGRGFAGPTHQTYRRDYHSNAPISLRDLKLGRGRTILAAANAHQPALESDQYGHGVFTYHLLGELRQPPSVRGLIGIGTLFDRVSRAVARETGDKQTPILNGTLELAALPLLGSNGSHAITDDTSNCAT
ncbi:MAG: caspase family protein [Proteobacteria bacterium]|nr:caspase family protein [Pseudomonadota bacterium]